MQPQMRERPGDLSLRGERRCDGGRETAADGVLLDRFVRDGDGSAFAEIVHRHSTLVYGVCHRILRNSHSSEDAFQATFLVSLRKAGTIRKRLSLGPRLHSVAHRIALHAKKQRAVMEAAMPHSRGNALESHERDLTLRELQTILDAEIRMLPERYQAPILLCYMEGLSNQAAAARLGCSLGTIAGWLSRARELLKKRLLRRGITAPFGFLLCFAGNASAMEIGGTVVERTIAMAVTAGRVGSIGLTAIPPSVLALAKGAGANMYRMVVGLVLAVLAMGIAIPVAVSRLQSEPPTTTTVAPAPKPVPEAKDRELETDMKRIVGEWQLSKIETSGPVNVDLQEYARWQFKADAVFLQFGQMPLEGKIALGANEIPDTVFLQLETWDKGKKEFVRNDFHGVYWLKGDALTLCIGPKKTAPKELRLQKEAGQQLLRFARVRERPAEVEPEKGQPPLNPEPKEKPVVNPLHGMVLDPGYLRDPRVQAELELQEAGLKSILDVPERVKQKYAMDIDRVFRKPEGRGCRR